MRTSVVWAVLLGLCMFVGTACPGPGRVERLRARDPLSLTKKPRYKVGYPDDNFFCYVCHVNFKTERFVVHHAKAGVGCSKCHGFSDDHSSDEDGLTPPEKMFTKVRVNEHCLECHREYKKTGVVCVYGTPGPHQVVEAKFCTDCHGDHRVTVRTRRWDKDTGKLIYDDGVRMIGSGSMGMK